MTRASQMPKEKEVHDEVITHRRRRVERGILAGAPQPEFRPANVRPYRGPRTREEWEEAFREMYANDETFREWRDAERAAEAVVRRIVS